MGWMGKKALTGLALVILLTASGGGYVAFQNPGLVEDYIDIDAIMDTGSPSQCDVVEEYWTALGNGDHDIARNLTTDDSILNQPIGYNGDDIDLQDVSCECAGSTILDQLKNWSGNQDLQGYGDEETHSKAGFAFTHIQANNSSSSTEISEMGVIMLNFKEEETEAWKIGFFQPYQLEGQIIANLTKTTQELGFCQEWANEKMPEDWNLAFY